MFIHFPYSSQQCFGPPESLTIIFQGARDHILVDVSKYLCYYSRQNEPEIPIFGFYFVCSTG